MTWANRITIVRILLVPFFIYCVLSYIDDAEEVYRFLAIVAFAVAALSDGIDGYIARRYHQKSELGAILDPLADKLLLVSGVVLLGFSHRELARLPLWLVATILSRDVLLLIGLIVIHYAVGKVAVRPHWTGKVATVLQMTSVLWALLKWEANGLRWIVLGAGLFTAISGLIYIRDGVRLLGKSPHSNPVSATPVERK